MLLYDAYSLVTYDYSLVIYDYSLVTDNYHSCGRLSVQPSDRPSRPTR